MFEQRIHRELLAKSSTPNRISKLVFAKHKVPTIVKSCRTTIVCWKPFLARQPQKMSSFKGFSLFSRFSIEFSFSRSGSH